MRPGHSLSGNNPRSASKSRSVCALPYPPPIHWPWRTVSTCRASRPDRRSVQTCRQVSEQLCNAPRPRPRLVEGAIVSETIAREDVVCSCSFPIAIFPIGDGETRGETPRTLHGTLVRTVAPSTRRVLACGALGSNPRNCLG